MDAALPPMVNFGPAERAKMVRTSIDISEKLGTVGAGYIPKNDQTTCNANSKGLFAYYRAAEAGLRTDVPHGRRHRIGLGGHHRHEGSGAHRRESDH